MRLERSETIEKLFGLLSVAMLGLFAIACVPNVKAEPVKPVVEIVKSETASKTVQTNTGIATEPSIDLELNAVEQVNAINSGAFTSFTAGN